MSASSSTSDESRGRHANPHEPVARSVHDRPGEGHAAWAARRILPKSEYDEHVRRPLLEQLRHPSARGQQQARDCARRIKDEDPAFWASLTPAEQAYEVRLQLWWDSLSHAQREKELRRHRRRERRHAERQQAAEFDKMFDELTGR